MPVNALEPVPVGVRLAQAIGITASAYVAGQMAGNSYQAVPAFLKAPAPLLAQQWRKSWEIGRKNIPIFGVLGVLFGWLAWREPIKSNSFKLYLTSALLIPSTIPYTLFFIKPLNDKLLAKSESFAATSTSTDAVAAAEAEAAEAEAREAQEETVHVLVDRWATRSLGRAVILGLGSLTAVGAALEGWRVVEV